MSAKPDCAWRRRRSSSTSKFLQLQNATVLADSFGSGDDIVSKLALLRHRVQRRRRRDGARAGAVDGGYNV